jgi:hypothetical protein
VAGVLLFACSLTLQLICAWTRALLALPLIWLSLLGLGASSGAYTLALVVGFAPLAISLVTLVFPYGGVLWEASVGGRRPSAREQATYEAALAGLQARAPALRAPRGWFVTDRSELQAAIYGDTLMLTRGLLSSASLGPVLGHELGHLNSTDGRLTAALYRMTTPPRNAVGLPWRAISFMATGEAAAWAMRLPWAQYWRAREFAADAFAAELDEATGLIDFLQGHALERDLPVPFPWLSSRSHPPTEHRIERLLEIEMKKEARQ